MAATESVDFMWRNRYALSRRRAHFPFWDAFEEYIRRIHSGERLRTRSLKNTPYWNYLLNYHNYWKSNPDSPRTIHQLRRKLTDAHRLYNSIKEEGMRDPLELHFRNGRLFIYKGMRRLVVAKVLGMPTIQYTIIDGDA